jgi:O-antigen/teichoic acid export membrane protein
MSNTKTIARNSGWYGLDTVTSALVAVISSIAIARTLGPSKTGYITYVNYIAGVVSVLGAFGIPAATRKYMAEFIGGGDKGTARYIFSRTFLLQIALATVATAAILIWALHDANSQYKLAAGLIALSIWPSMVNAIPSSANAANENLAANVPSSVIAAVCYLIGIGATARFGWGVVGIGAALLFMRTLDMLIRFFLTMRSISGWNRGLGIPEGLPRRMVRFAWQSVLSMLLAFIVWERCEILLLKNLNPDIRQVAFYGIACSIASYLLLGSTIFNFAAANTFFAQYGRDKSKLPQLTATSLRYIVLISIPAHFVFSALAVPGLLFFYRAAYAGAAMVVTIAPIFCMPKAFATPIISLFQSTEHQKYTIAALVVASFVDIGVASALIPAYGAVGASIGSGVAQYTAVGILWTVGVRKFGVKIPWAFIAKVAGISTAAALTAHFVAAPLHPLWGLLAGGPAALLVFFTLVYAFRILTPEDRVRFDAVIRMLPARAARPIDRFLAILVRQGPRELYSETSVDSNVYTDAQ